MADMKKTANKLIKALTTVAGYKVTLQSKQFFAQEGFTLTYYSVSHAVWDEDKHRYLNVELYSSTSMTRIVLFLRDGWYCYQGKALPTDQELWNNIREGLISSGKYWPQYLSEIQDRQC